MRTMVLSGVGLIAAAFAVAFKPAAHVPMRASALVPDEQRIPLPKEKRGKRSSGRCPKSERMLRTQAERHRTSYHIRAR